MKGDELGLGVRWGQSKDTFDIGQHHSDFGTKRSGTECGQRVIVGENRISMVIKTILVDRHGIIFINDGDDSKRKETLDGIP
jgi:hypothetical protein